MLSLLYTFVQDVQWLLILETACSDIVVCGGIKKWHYCFYGHEIPVNAGLHSGLHITNHIRGNVFPRSCRSIHSSYFLHSYA